MQGRRGRSDPPQGIVNSFADQIITLDGLIRVELREIGSFKPRWTIQIVDISEA